jgi:segregation and condensation protein B
VDDAAPQDDVAPAGGIAAAYDAAPAWDAAPAGDAAPAYDAAPAWDAAPAGDAAPADDTAPADAADLPEDTTTAGADDVSPGDGTLEDSTLDDNGAPAGGAGPQLRPSLEAIMLVADEPVSEVVLAQVLERPRAEVATALRDLAAGYTAEQRGFDLREVAGGWRLYTREEFAPVVERFVSDGQEVRLTQAALETLAVVAYRQPVSRARVSAVRGVNCDGVIRTLVLRGLVEEAGTDPETGAILFATTQYFLERLGLPSLDALPDLAPFLPENIDDDTDLGHESPRQ